MNSWLQYTTAYGQNAPSCDPLTPDQSNYQLCQAIWTGKWTKRKYPSYFILLSLIRASIRLATSLNKRDLGGESHSSKCHHIEIQICRQEINRITYHQNTWRPSSPHLDNSPHSVGYGGWLIVKSETAFIKSQQRNQIATIFKTRILF